MHTDFADGAKKSLKVCYLDCLSMFDHFVRLDTLFHICWKKLMRLFWFERNGLENVVRLNFCNINCNSKKTSSRSHFKADFSVSLKKLFPSSNVASKVHIVMVSLLVFLLPSLPILPKISMF